MIYKFTTESASEYIIDTTLKTWKRKKGIDATDIRTDEGKYHNISEIELGQRVTMECDPLTEDASFRLITSTPIIALDTVG